MNVYLSPENQLPSAPWILAFPTLEPELAGLRAKRETLRAALPPPDTTSWAYVESESVEKKMEDLRHPPLPSRIDDNTPMMKMQKLPSNFVVYRTKPGERYTKELRLKSLLDKIEEYESFGMDIPGQLTQLADAYTFPAIIRAGFRPSQTERGFERGPVLPLSPPQRKIFHAIHDLLPEDTKPVVAPRVEEALVPPPYWDLPREVYKLPTGCLDDISFVTYALNTNGHVIKEATDVVRQSPNPLVRATYRVNHSGFLLGIGYGKNKKEAKQFVFSQLRALLIERHTLPTLSETEDNTHDDAEQEEQNRETEAEATTAEDPGAHDATVPDSPEQTE